MWRLRHHGQQFWLAAIAIMFVLCLSPATSAEEIAELADRTGQSVVHLHIVGRKAEETGSGTGFFVAEGRIVTNYHVIEMASEAVARLSDGRELEVLGVLASDEEHDLAVIQVTAEGNPPPLLLSDGQSVEQGREVFVIGSPYGLQGTLSTGIVSAVRADGVDDPQARERLAGWGIQITADIAPGSSGSPVLTHDGKVIAVAVGMVGGDSRVGFGIPIDMVHRLLATIPADAKPQPLPNAVSVWRNLLISAIAFGALGLAFAIPSLIKRLKRLRS